MNKKVRRCMIGLVCLIVVFAAVPAFADNYQDRSDIIVVVDSKTVNFPDQPPVIDADAGRILIPVRFPAETLGASVDWLNNTRQVHIVNKAHDALKDADLMLTIGKKTLVVNGANQLMDTTPIIRKDRTLVPLRFISEYLGATVQWLDKDGIKAAFVFTKGQSEDEQNQIIQSIINEKKTSVQDMGSSTGDQDISAVGYNLYISSTDIGSSTMFLCIGDDSRPKKVIRVVCTSNPELNLCKWSRPDGTWKDRPQDVWTNDYMLFREGYTTNPKSGMTLTFDIYGGYTGDDNATGVKIATISKTLP